MASRSPFSSAASPASCLTRETPLWLDPSLWALVFACLGAAAMALPARSRRVTPESAVALAYLGASAFVLLVLASPRIAQEAHEIGDLLFGNAVVVRRQDLWNLGFAALLILLVHGVLFRSFLFASFDPDTARVSGVPVRTVELVLHLSLAVAVAVATRALGALPVFSLLVLPGGAALLFSETAPDRAPPRGADRGVCPPPAGTCCRGRCLSRPAR